MLIALLILIGQQSESNMDFDISESVGERVVHSREKDAEFSAHIYLAKVTAVA